MPFLPADQIPPKGVARYIPPYFQGKKYVRLNRGDVRHCVYIVKNEYQAKDKNYEPIFSKVDGSPVMRVIYYLGFDDDTYTTVKNDIVIGQIDSWIAPYQPGPGNSYDLVELGDDQRIRFGETKQRMGDKEYPVPIIEMA